MKVLCLYRESKEAFLCFELDGLKPPPILAIPEIIDKHRYLREFELFDRRTDLAIYLETEESAGRLGLAA